MKAIEISSLSLKSIFIEMRFDEQVLASGTAFVTQTVRGPVLITNRHNATGKHQQLGTPLSKTGGIPNNFLVHLPHLGPSPLSTYQKIIPLTAGDTPCWMEHPLLRAQADFVLLPITGDTPLLHPYKLGPSGAPFKISRTEKVPLNDGDVPLRVRPADRVSIIGFPFGLRVAGQLPLWANGFIASEPQVNYEDLPVFLVDCRSRQGQSGSPVVAVQNSGMAALENSDMVQALFTSAVSRFLGIYSGRISPESDLGYVWKASAIRELVQYYEAAGLTC